MFIMYLVSCNVFLGSSLGGLSLWAGQLQQQPIGLWNFVQFIWVEDSILIQVIISNRPHQN